MEKDPWEDFIREITKQQEQKSALEKRKTFKDFSDADVVVGLLTVHNVVFFSFDLIL